MRQLKKVIPVKVKKTVKIPWPVDSKPKTFMFKMFDPDDKPKLYVMNSGREDLKVIGMAIPQPTGMLLKRVYQAVCIWLFNSAEEMKQ